MTGDPVTIPRKARTSRAAAPKPATRLVIGRAFVRALRQAVAGSRRPEAQARAAPEALEGPLRGERVAAQGFARVLRARSLAIP